MINTYTIEYSKIHHSVLKYCKCNYRGQRDLFNLSFHNFREQVRQVSNKNFFWWIGVQTLPVSRKRWCTHPVLMHSKKSLLGSTNTFKPMIIPKQARRLWKKFWEPLIVSKTKGQKTDFQNVILWKKRWNKLLPDFSCGLSNISCTHDFELFLNILGFLRSLAHVTNALECLESISEQF